MSQRTRIASTSESTISLVSGLVSADSATKQRLGQTIGKALGFKPGPRGRDDGIDGEVEYRGRWIHFQCKLSQKPLGKDHASIYIADVRKHREYRRFDASICLAGVGYTDPFHEQLAALRQGTNCDICLLTLADMFDMTAQFERATRILPTIRELQGNLR